MNAVLEIIERGGPVMIPIIVISVVIYERCLHLLLLLTAARRAIARLHPRTVHRAEIATWQSELPAAYDRHRTVIGALVAAAPLLGLLGTVTGMIETFGSLASRAGAQAREGLASGISQALITTETGLAVVIPAVVLLYYAHRQLQKGIHQLAELEGSRTRID